MEKQHTPQGAMGTTHSGRKEMPLAEMFAEIDDPELRQTMEERLKRLAAPPPSERSDNAEPVLTAVIGSERYGFPLAHVAEVIQLTTLTQLAGVPGHILGLTNLRGEVILVIDIRVFFGLDTPDLTDLPLAIVVHRGEAKLAVLIDEVESIELRTREELNPPISTHTGILEEYQIGLADDRSVVLNLERILTDPRLIVDQDA